MAAHGVHEVVGGAASFECVGEAFGGAEIPGHHVDLVAPRPAVELLGGAGEASHRVAGAQELRDEATTHVARGSGDEDGTLGHARAERKRAVASPWSTIGSG